MCHDYAIIRLDVQNFRLHSFYNVLCFKKINGFIIHPYPQQCLGGWGIYRNHLVCLSVCLQLYPVHIIPMEKHRKFLFHTKIAYDLDKGSFVQVQGHFFK